MGKIAIGTLDLFSMFAGESIVKSAFLNGATIYEEEQGENFLTFSSPNSFTLGVTDTSKIGWDGELEYSTDKTTWDTWDGSTIAPILDEGVYYLYLRGRNNTVITGQGKATFVLSGSDISCSGNIETLLDYQTVKSGGHPQMGIMCYAGMFMGCTSLTSAPELPATTLAVACYGDMFYGCTSLTSAPALPATTLAGYCYFQMFYGCTSLTTAPALPATTLAEQCYYEMFRGCTSLTFAPVLPATTLADSCYSGMFEGCTSIETLPSLPATTLLPHCYSNMFYGCSLIKLSTTQSAEYTNAYTIPSQGTGTTASSALNNMFTNTGGSFQGSPTINTTYYTSNTIV